MSHPRDPDTVQSALRRASAELTTVSESPKLDARVLLSMALNRSPAWLIAHSGDLLTQEQLGAFDRALARRRAGEPVAYITGQREFWSLNLTVSAGTLIPRPDTETLVDVALQLIANRPNARILDLGTGTGAVALALAKERADARVTATDRSQDALAVAAENARAHHLNERVALRRGDWFEAVTDEEPFDLVVSNPPYVRRDDPHLAQGDVRFEPELALVAGGDGLSEIRRIVPGSFEHLVPGGWLAVEHGADQGDAVAALFRAAHFGEVKTVSDLAGQPRVTCGRRA